MTRQTEIESPVVDGWDNAYLRRSRSWRSTIASDAIRELRRHLEQYGRLERQIHAADFPALGAEAAKLHEQLAHQHGLAWIRPSADEQISNAHHEALCSALCSLMGLAHRPLDTPTVERPALGTARTDALIPDAIGIVRLSRPAPESEIYAVSAVAVHRELESLHPDLLRVLYRPVVHGVVVDLDTGHQHTIREPVFRYDPRARALEFRYDRDAIERSHAEVDIPLERLMTHAFDALDKTMNLPHLLASIRPDRGDMVFVNNRRVASAGLTTVPSDDVDQRVRVLRVVHPASHTVTSTVSEPSVS